MSENHKSVALVSDDAAFSARIGALLEATPGIALTQCNSTLSGLNGKASEIAQRSELVIFKTQSDPNPDVMALRSIVQSGAKARLLAISDSEASLGAAHSLLRAGVAEVVPDTLDDAELGRVVSRLSMSRRLVLTAPRAMEGQVIAVSRARGGIGATTLAVNLADALCRQNGRFGLSGGTSRKVALVDLDLQFGAVAGFLDLPPSDALYTLARDHVDPDQVFLDQSIRVTPSGLAVLTAPAGFLPLNAITVDQVRALIQSLRQNYAFVVIDLPHVMVDWLSPVLEAASKVCVVTGTTVPFIQQSRRMIDFFREQSPNIEIEIVVGKQKRPMFRSRRQAEAEKALGHSFRHWLPPDEHAASEAMDQGKPLSQVASRSALNKVVRAMAREILKVTDAKTPRIASRV